MRNRRLLGLMLVLAIAVALSVAFAQSQEKSTTAAPAKSSAPAGMRATNWPWGSESGTLYQGAGVQTIVGKPKKLGTQEDEGGYQLVPTPDSEKNKPYDHRRMTGVWENIAASNITETVGTHVPPMTAKGKEMFAQTRPGSGPRAVGRDQNDGDNICDPLGWPRIVYQPIRPVEFFTTSDRQIQHWAWRDQWRTIWTDGRGLPKDPDPLWYGYAVGRWEGEKFHEVTNGEDDRTWLSRWGHVHSLGMVVHAVWRQLDHNTITLDITIHDPEIYTEDWVGAKNYFQLFPHLDVDALPCAGSEEVFYRDQMRANYPKDEDVKKKAPTAPTVIVPPVNIPNTGVGGSKLQ